MVVADDSSTDKTLEIIKSYEAKSLFPFVYCEKQENLGIGRNYYRGFEKCRGEYIMIIEGDDYWFENHLQQHLDFLEAHQEVAIAMNSMTTYNINREVCVEWKCQEGVDFAYIDGNTQARANRLGNLSACSMRACYVKQIPYEKIISGVDWLYGILLSEYGKIAVLRETTSFYRTNENSVYASKSMSRKMEGMISAAKRYDQLLDYKYHKEFQELIDDLTRQLTPSRYIKDWIKDKISPVMPFYYKYIKR